MIFSRNSNDRGYIGFGGNVSGTLVRPVATEARSKLMMKRFQISAPPLRWGRWQEVFAQLGVKGPDADRHVTKVNISLSTDSHAPSSFDYEIKGGDRLIRGVVGGSGVSETVIISGNVATAISVRAKSHSQAQRVIVAVS